MEIFGPGGVAVEAGVVSANIVNTYGDKNPNYGMGESRLDYSVKAENSNGSMYYKKRDIVRSYDILVQTTREEAINLENSFDNLGEIPSGWKLTDLQGNDFVVYGKFDGPPQISHSYPQHSDVNFRIIEVL